MKLRDKYMLLKEIMYYEYTDINRCSLTDSERGDKNKKPTYLHTLMNCHSQKVISCICFSLKAIRNLAAMNVPRFCPHSEDTSTRHKYWTLPSVPQKKPWSGAIWFRQESGAGSS